MAAEFLRIHGVDIDAEMARIQAADPSIPSLSQIQNVSLPGTPPGTKWTVEVEGENVKQVRPYEHGSKPPLSAIDGHGGLLTPSLCHPHIHLDKAYLLSHPRYGHLQVEKGDFQEAMDLTSQAKSQFERTDLLERGQRVIDESVAAGVTHMRAFVEIDAGVHKKCLDAGIELKKAASDQKTCLIQLCAFAQLPLFSPAKGDDNGAAIRNLMLYAAETADVEAIGSTPYVEADRVKMKRNVEWMVDLSIEFNLHLDFHLDYNLDSHTEPLVWHVIETLKGRQWKQRTSGRTIVLGHCTRLTLWKDAQWQKLANDIAEADLPVSFVGLPTSDLFMMRTGEEPELRGTLNVPKLIEEYGLNACLGINNIGNAFTPQGSCDPLILACQGVGIYQAGTKRDTELLFECISTRAKAAIGFAQQQSPDLSLRIQAGAKADFVLFRGCDAGREQWRSRKSRLLGSQGNVTGGHFVEQLPDRHLRLEPTHPSMARDAIPQGPSGHRRRGYFPHARRNLSGRQPNPLFLGPSGLSNAPPSAPAALRHGFHAQGQGYQNNQFALPPFQHQPAPHRQNHFPGLTHPPYQRESSFHPTPIPHPQQLQPSPYLPPSSGEFQSHHKTRAAPAYNEDHHAVPPEVPQFGDIVGSLTASYLPIDDDHAVPSKAVSPPTDSVDKLEMAQHFVTRFIAQFQGDETALTTFLGACNAYNTRNIDETDFYAEVYRILYTRSSLHLLDGLLELLPSQWRDADLTWLNKAIEVDCQKKVEEDKENKPAPQPHVAKKKRPINGFKTSHNSAASAHRAAVVKLPINFHGQATPEATAKAESNLISSAATTRKVQHDQGHLVKLPVKLPKTAASSSVKKGKTVAAQAKKAKTTTTQKVTPAKRTAVPSQDDSAPAKALKIKGNNRYTSKYAAEISHYGPVYKDRRSVFARGNKPYIHAACGQGFAHPQDVKSHEKKSRGGAGCHAPGKEWDDHPSCKVTYPELNYCQVKDGYVILDQESFDKLEGAIAAGLAYHKQVAKEGGKQTRNASVGQSGASEDVGGDEDDTEDNMEGIEHTGVYGESELRAAALGLRKRSVR
ncbi:hypothetical protein PRZ48_004275 [Zasmidium cellare]|uniref:Cytosine deaminase n=1 Tax=Zasmidium cellare TaxID=395010 RepID=A0ABR0EPE1_ZASCE|nr:hypothetical protein PRZ48_004275 [Zasmidium cellare]